MRRDIRVYIEDILTHEYFGVSLERAWIVIKDDIFKLRSAISKVKSDLV